MTAHEWTTDPPTEPGMFWGIHKREGLIPVIVAPDPHEDGDLGANMANCFHDYLESFTHWMRIDAPEPPK